MKRLWMGGIVFCCTIFLVACYPVNTGYVHEKDISLTYRDGHADFGNYKTFIMPDSVVIIQDKGDSVQMEVAVQREILSLVKENFISRNFRLLSGQEALEHIPDFIVTVTVVATPEFSFAAWSNYWDWYAGWNRLGWKKAGKGYKPRYDTKYLSASGILVIDVLDAKNTGTGTTNIPVLWSAVNSGILAGKQIFLCGSLERNIRQCFLQSPYLITYQ